MYRGVSELNLDDKGRMVMPTRYRQSVLDDCSGKLVITIDRDRCLLIYPFPAWQVVEQKLNSLSGIDRRVRRLQRLMIGYAHDVDMDRAGRIRLPQPLRDYASIEKRVVLIGQGNKFELWDEETWNRQRDIWLEEEEQDNELSDELKSLQL